MIELLRKALFDGQLFWRVTIFMTGVLLAVIPTAALTFGVANRQSDPALLILLCLIAALAGYFIYAAICVEERALDTALNWFVMSELLFILGVLTLALPITLIIRVLRREHDRDATQ